MGSEGRDGCRRVVILSELEGHQARLTVRMDPAGEMVGIIQAEDHEIILRHVRTARPIVRVLLRRLASQLEIPGVVAAEKTTNTRERAGPAPVQLRIPGT